MGGGKSTRGHLTKLDRCNLCKSRTEDRLYSSKWARQPRMLIVHTQTNHMTSETRQIAKLGLQKSQQNSFLSEANAKFQAV